MMDYYSNFPAPSKEVAIEEVVKHILNSNSEVEESLIRETATVVINKMPSLGSYTGWYAGFKGDAIKEVKTILKI
jgi:hypothetical protein